MAHVVADATPTFWNDSMRAVEVQLESSFPVTGGCCQYEETAIAVPELSSYSENQVGRIVDKGIWDAGLD